MWILVLIVLLLVVTPSFAEQRFSEQYERDYNIFNPANRFDPGNPANRYNLNTPFAPLNRSR